MNWRNLLSLATLAAALALPAPAAAEDPLLVAGPIQKVDREGRIYVADQPLVLTRDTEILDHTYRVTTAPELVPGVQVEVTYENTAKGATATKIIATLMR